MKTKYVIVIYARCVQNINFFIIGKFTHMSAANIIISWVNHVISANVQKCRNCKVMYFLGAPNKNGNFTYLQADEK
jgi:hypothetical protein